MTGRYDRPVPFRELTLGRPSRRAVHLAGHFHLVGPGAREPGVLHWPDVRNPSIRGAARGKNESCPHWR
jgi:hypothetical protein